MVIWQKFILKSRLCLFGTIKNGVIEFVSFLRNQRLYQIINDENRRTQEEVYGGFHWG